MDKEARKKICKKWNDANKEKIKKYRENNRENAIEYQKIYREKNKEKQKTLNDKHYQENKEKIKKQAQAYRNSNKSKINEHTKSRRKIDPLFKLSGDIRSLIGDSLRKNGFKKKSRTYEILGCSFEEFKLHLESKFEPWMNWNNRGNWNGTPKEKDVAWDIDHIIPPSSAATEKEITQLNHYTNLQPLCSYTNRWIKINKII